MSDVTDGRVVYVQAGKYIEIILPLQGDIGTFGVFPGTICCDLILKRLKFRNDVVHSEFIRVYPIAKKTCLILSGIM